MKAFKKWNNILAKNEIKKSDHDSQSPFKKKKNKKEREKKTTFNIVDLKRDSFGLPIRKYFEFQIDKKRKWNEYEEDKSLLHWLDFFFSFVFFSPN